MFDYKIEKVLMVLDNILGAIGKTPIVKFNRIGNDLDCDLYGKCEYLNAGGSVKERETDFYEGGGKELLWSGQIECRPL